MLIRGLHPTAVPPRSRAYNDANFWRPTSSEDPLSNTTSYSYPAALASPGTQVLFAQSSLNFNGSTSTQTLRATLDALGRTSVTQTRQSQTAANYDSVQTEYDSDGRTKYVTMPYSATAGSGGGSVGTTTLYDGVNRVTKVTDGGGGWTTYTYPVSGDNFLKYTVIVEQGPAPTGENTKKRQVQYDGIGRVVAVCEVSPSVTGSGDCGHTRGFAALGFLTNYAYTGLAQLAASQNAQTGGTAQSRSYSWDGLNRLTSETNPESGTTVYHWDIDSSGYCTASSGDLVYRKDAVGNVRCYSYDALHRLTKVTYPAGTYATATPQKNYVYDSATVNGAAMQNAKNRLAEAWTGASIMSKITDIGFSYDADGNTTDTYEYTPHSVSYYHVQASYWPNGLVDVLSSNISGLPSMTYTPDGEGRISTMAAATGQNPVTATSYNTSSQVTGLTLGSADSDVFSFDANTGRPTGYTFNVDGHAESGTITNNADGDMAKLVISDYFNASDSQTCNYTYDDLNRLITDNCGSVWGAQYSYDAYGNIDKSVISGSPGTQFLPTYGNSTNRFATLPASTPTYDANGNLTADGFHTYAWDADGNLITVDGVTGTFDALQRRVELGTSPNYSQMLFSPADPRHPIGLAASLTATGIRLPLPGGGEVEFNSSGTWNYRHPNWQGSQLLLSWTTATTPTYGSAFTAFGEKYAVDSSGFNGYFAGMLGIADEGGISDAYQADARLMQQAQGRWVSPDPAGIGAVDMTNPQSWNRYAYVLNNPLKFVDLSGLINCEPPLVVKVGQNGEPSTCVAGNPSTTSTTLGSCAQAVQQNGGPVDGCPDSTPNGNQNATGAGSGTASIGNLKIAKQIAAVSNCTSQAQAAMNAQPSVTPPGQNAIDGVGGGVIGLALGAWGLPEDAPILPVLYKAFSSAAISAARRSGVHAVQQGLVFLNTYHGCLSAAGVGGPYNPYSPS